MIGKLSGIIDSFGPDHLILDVGGVGYIVYASRKTLGTIGQEGDPASLLIETQVREDSLTLFGFSGAREQQWFKLLTSVQGVGARVALAILAACPPEKLPLIIASQDQAAIRQADGVGPKLATRIVTELKDKAGDLTAKGDGVKTGAFTPSPVVESVDNDAVSALINLGYPRAQAFQAVMSAKVKANDNLQDLIRAALKELSA